MKFWSELIQNELVTEVFICGVDPPQAFASTAGDHWRH